MKKMATRRCEGAIRRRRLVTLPFLRGSRFCKNAKPGKMEKESKRPNDSHVTLLNDRELGDGLKHVLTKIMGAREGDAVVNALLQCPYHGCFQPP